MMRKLFTEPEIVLCTFIARFGRSSFNERKIVSLQNRSEGSIKMKVQNIAAMLDEEGFAYSDEVTPLSGKTTGENGRRTNWNIVRRLTGLDRDEFHDICSQISTRKNLMTCS